MDQQDLGGLSFPGSSTCHSSQRLFFFFLEILEQEQKQPQAAEFSFSLY